MYQAIITPIINIRSHNNADRLVLGTVAGHQVITSKDIKEGTIGIFFPSDGQLSAKMCEENNFYRHTNLNKDSKAKGGFFEDNRRIRIQKFRGEVSEGFWSPLSILKWTDTNIDDLKSGDLLEELNGHSICNKYYTPATRRAMGKGSRKERLSKLGRLKDLYPLFYQHWDVKKLRMMIGYIPEGAVLSITEKCHGTSARTGRLPEFKRLNWFQKIWNNTVGKSRLKFQEYKYKYISGTRRVVLDPELTEDQGFYSGKQFRSKIHNSIKDVGLFKGETLYYEIVGYSSDKGLIMGSHDIKDESLKKKYGNAMVYKYGCLPEQYKILIYRITHTSPDDHVTELSWYQMTYRCSQLGFTAVPQLKDPFIYDSNQETLLTLCNNLSKGNSTLDCDHIREGVVLRVEAPNINIHYKFKSYWFCELEQIKKNDDTYVDPEEIS